MGLTGCLRFHRAELERWRDLLRSVGVKYIAPLMPGLISSANAPALTASSGSGFSGSSCFSGGSQ
jgi:hypothetical protein